MAAPRLSKGRHGLLVKLEKIWPSIWLTVCPHPLKSGVRNRDFCKLETRDRRPKGKPPPPQTGRGKEMSGFLKGLTQH